MKKRKSKKLELKIQKISKIGATSIKGGQTHQCTYGTCPRYTENFTNCYVSKCILTGCGPGTTGPTGDPDTTN